MDGVHSQVNNHFFFSFVDAGCVNNPSFCMLENTVHLVYLKKKVAFLYVYRSVPLIRSPPPHFVHYIQPKVGGGLIFEYAISLEYKPPPPPPKVLRDRYITECLFK